MMSVEDIGALRLTCRDVASRASKSVFRTYFTTHRLRYESPAQLRALKDITRPGSMGTFLKHLCIVGQTQTSLPTEAPQEHAHGTAPSVIRALAGVALTSMTLSVHDNRPPEPPISMHSARRKPPKDWRPVWESATHTFAFAMAVLAAQQSSVQKLDVFHSSAACSLAIDQLGLALELMILRPLQNLRHLSISLSGHAASRDQDGAGLEEDAAERHVAQVGRFINISCPAMKSLDLHWYSLRAHDLSPAQQIERSFFREVAGFHRFVSLQTISLAGIYTTGSPPGLCRKQQEAVQHHYERDTSQG